MTELLPARFVVGTGRCGSTLLSRMLAQHPGALSIFEFFNGLEVSKRFAKEAVSGEEMAALLCAEQPLLSAVLRRGYQVPEVHYPFETGRLAPRDPLPWILVGAIPQIHPDPDAFYQETRDFLVGQPAQSPADHYRELFAWWVHARRSSFWVERSGSSVEYLAELVQQFPRARFVHIHRDGAEVALSMQAYPAYRLPVALMYRAVGRGACVPDWAELDFGAEPASDDALSQLLAAPPEAEVFARYWSDQLRRGRAAFPALRSERLLAVAFEDLVARPRDELVRIAAFFDLPASESSADWIGRAASLVRGRPALRAPALAPDARARLERACEPGREALAAYSV